MLGISEPNYFNLRIYDRKKLKDSLLVVYNPEVNYKVVLPPMHREAKFVQVGKVNIVSKIIKEPIGYYIDIEEKEVILMKGIPLVCYILPFGKSHLDLENLTRVVEFYILIKRDIVDKLSNFVVAKLYKQRYVVSTISLFPAMKAYLLPRGYVRNCELLKAVLIIDYHGNIKVKEIVKIDKDKLQLAELTC